MPNNLMFLIALLLTPLACAKQQFNKQAVGENTRYQYQWLDHQGQQRDLRFTLSKQAIGQQQARASRYQARLAKRYVFLALQKAAMQVDPKQARIHIRPQGQDYQVLVSSRTPGMLEKWQQNMAQEEQKAYTEYLQQHYYNRFKNHLGQQGVKPDHLRFAREHSPLVLPAAQAIYEQIDNNSDARPYINLLLSWVQNIPYDRLENRLSSNGAGFFSPVEVIANNKGDCDSKSTLSIALLKALLPKIPMAMIYLPKHALIGAALPARDNEAKLTLEGIDYLLMEPTGPAPYSLGKIAPNSQAAINSGMYTHELVP